VNFSSGWTIRGSAAAVIVPRPGDVSLSVDGRDVRVIEQAVEFYAKDSRQAVPDEQSLADHEIHVLQARGVKAHTRGIPGPAGRPRNECRSVAARLPTGSVVAAPGVRAIGLDLSRQSGAVYAISIINTGFGCAAADSTWPTIRTRKSRTADSFGRM
jgi:hypothetical protein